MKLLVFFFCLLTISQSSGSGSSANSSEIASTSDIVIETVLKALGLAPKDPVSTPATTNSSTSGVFSWLSSALSRLNMTGKIDSRLIPDNANLTINTQLSCSLKSQWCFKISVSIRNKYKPLSEAKEVGETKRVCTNENISAVNETIWYFAQPNRPHYIYLNILHNCTSDGRELTIGETMNEYSKFLHNKDLVNRGKIVGVQKPEETNWFSYSSF